MCIIFIIFATMEKNKVVYVHRNPTNNEVFYVGMGNKRRPYSKDRSVFWKRYVKKYGEPVIEIVESNLTKQDAWDSEVALIELIGRRDKRKGSLVNLSDGGDGGLNTIINIGVIDLNTGEIFRTSTEAAKYYGVKQGHLSNHLSGKKLISKVSHLRGINRDGTVRWQSEDDDGFDYKEFEYKKGDWVEMLAYDLDACGSLDLRNSSIHKKDLRHSQKGRCKSYNHKTEKVNKLRKYIKKIMF